VDVMRELARVVAIKRYPSVTFYLNAVPIITVNFDNNNNATLFMNNMEEIRSKEITYKRNVDVYVSEVYDALVYNGIDELIRTSKDQKVTFRSGSNLHGTISRDGVVVEMDEGDLSDKREPKMVHKKYEISTDIELSGFTVAQIVGMFAYQPFL